MNDDSKRLSQIERRIGKIKEQLQKIGEMRPGSLTRQYKNPEEKKGAYYQLSYTYKMRSRTEYVRLGAVTALRLQIAEFKLFKDLTQEWIDLALEYSRLKIKLVREEDKQ